MDKSAHWKPRNMSFSVIASFHYSKSQNYYTNHIRILANSILNYNTFFFTIVLILK